MKPLYAALLSLVVLAAPAAAIPPAPYVVSRLVDDIDHIGDPGNPGDEFCARLAELAEREPALRDLYETGCTEGASVCVILEDLKTYEVETLSADDAATLRALAADLVASGACVLICLENVLRLEPDDCLP